ncbi:MAG: rane-bound hydrogenase subunit ehaG, partial [Methanomicrobia archaeon]|nr:rane-bound hydrogenase subunit ehaG [Methanomicrobia archaeon]
EIVFFFMAKGHREDFSLLEAAAGISWGIWVCSFFVFMFLPQYWMLAVLGAGAGILLKVTAKMSLVGTMWGKPHE